MEEITSEVVVESLVVETVPFVDYTETTILTPADDDLLEEALLTAEDLNAAPALDRFGDELGTRRRRYPDRRHGA